MKRAAYIGKFQPFHIGHVGVVEYIAEAPDIDEIVIGIGSAQWNWQNRNPERPLDNIFTWAERKEMIEKSLRGRRINKKIHIFPVLDFLPKWGKDSTPKWFDYIKNNSSVEFHCLYTNRGREAELFGGGGYEVRAHPLKYGFSATIIREKMAYGGIWRPLVCREALGTIQKAEGEKRAAEIFSGTEINPEEYGDLSWEWRTFDQPTQEDLEKILALPLFRSEKIRDRYLFSLVKTTVNFKLRKDGLKIKKLVAAQNGLEAWASFECDFPVDRNFLVGGCKEIKFSLPQGLPESINEKDLLTSVPKEVNPYLFLFSVEKTRSMHVFKEEEIRCGVDASFFALPSGEKVATIGLEAKTKKDVEATLIRLGLKKYKPMNYLQFLEKFICEETKNDIWQKL